MSERQKIVDAVVMRAKAAGRNVYGFSVDKASCQILDKQVPKHWDFICAEGDTKWTRLPRE